MHTQITKTPAHDAYTLLEGKILKNHSKVILFISGGSALDILDHMSDQCAAHIDTITVIDERLHVDSPDQNIVKLYEKEDLISKLSTARVDIIPRDFFEGLTPIEAEKKYREYLKKLLKKDLHIHATLGVGEDGHTAGILPQSGDMTYRELFCTSELIRAYTSPQAAFPERITVTPTFLAEHVDHAVVYAANESKKEVLNALLKGDNAQHIMPANVLHNMRSVTLITDQRLCVPTHKNAIVLDFDHTLFNTTLYVAKLKENLNNVGIAPEIFDKHRQALKSCCALVDIDRFVQVLPHEDKDLLKQTIHGTIRHSAQEFIFADAQDFITRHKDHFDIIVMTQGDQKLQSEKITHSKLHHIDHIFISHDSKDTVFADIADRYDQIHYVDDKAKHIDEVKQAYPKVTSYFIKRPEDQPYGDKPSSCNCADHIITDLSLTLT